MIATEPTKAGNPGNGSFDDPSSGERTKRGWRWFVLFLLLALGKTAVLFGPGESLDRFHSPSHLHEHPEKEVPPVVTISPNERHSGKPSCEWQEKRSASFLIGTMRSRHFDAQEMALRIHEQVAFAPPDFFFPRRSLFQGHEPHSF